MGIGTKAVEAEARLKALAQAAAEKDLDEVKSIVRRLKPLNTADDVARTLKDVASLQKEKKRRASSLQSTLKNLSIVRDRFFRELANSQTKFRALANARDELTRKYVESRARAKRDDRTGENVKRKFQKDIKALEAEASRIAGTRIRADEFETLVTRTRRLTSQEEEFVDLAKQDAREIRKELTKFRRANNAAIARVEQAIGGIGKFSGVQGTKIGTLDVTAQVQNAASNALNKLHTFLQQLRAEQGDLAIGIQQAEAIEEAAQRGMTIEAAETFAARLSNLSFIGAAVGILAGAGASPIIGVLLALGLIAKLFNRLFSEIEAAKRIIER